MENMSEFIKYVFKCTMDTFWAGIDASSNSKPSAVDIITGLVGMALVVFFIGFHLLFDFSPRISDD